MDPAVSDWHGHRLRTLHPGGRHSEQAACRALRRREIPCLADSRLLPPNPWHRAHLARIHRVRGQIQGDGMVLPARRILRLYSRTPRAWLFRARCEERPDCVHRHMAPAMSPISRNARGRSHARWRQDKPLCAVRTFDGRAASQRPCSSGTPNIVATRPCCRRR